MFFFPMYAPTPFCVLLPAFQICRSPDFPITRSPDSSPRLGASAVGFHLRSSAFIGGEKVLLFLIRDDPRYSAPSSSHSDHPIPISVIPV
jgi:hypothetical protein